MKALYKIAVCLLALSMCLSLKAQNDGNDMFVPIAKYLSSGSAENLSAWFADNLEISVVSSLTNSSKSQAQEVRDKPHSRPSQHEICAWYPQCRR